MDIGGAAALEGRRRIGLVFLSIEVRNGVIDLMLIGLIWLG